MTCPTDLADLAPSASLGHNCPPATVTKSCAECGYDFDAPATGPGQHKRFCSDKHRKAFNNRNNAQGGPLMPLLKAWRVARSSPKHKDVGAAAFSEICSILDAMIAEDRKDGRTTEGMIAYVRESLASGFTYQDRQAWNAKADWRNKADD